MPVFNLGDCVRIGDGADPSLVGLEGTRLGTPWSVEERAEAPLSELISFFRVALSDGRVVEVEAVFVERVQPRMTSLPHRRSSTRAEGTVESASAVKVPRAHVFGTRFFPTKTTEV